MKKFILKTSFIFLILILLNIIIFLVFYHEDHKKYNEFSTESEIYLISDSHGEALKDYTEIGNINNFSFESDSYTDTERKLLFLIKRSKVKKIIISVDSHCFSDYREKIDNSDKSIFYQSVFSGEGKVFENLKNKYIRYYLPVFNKNSPTLIKVTVAKKINELKGIVKDTTKWEMLTEDYKSKDAKRRIGVQFVSNNYSYKMEESFHRILKLAQSNGIEIIAIKFPVTKQYSDHLNRVNKFQSKIDQVISTYKNIKFVDFQKIYFEHDAFFKDADHLNDHGAKEFSKLLSNHVSE